MATADRAASARWPRRPLLIALLVVSLVLNLFFIVGAVWSRVNAPSGLRSPEQRYQRIAAELDLTPAQRTRFEQYVSAMRERSRKMHQQIAPLIAGAWEEIAGPQPDAAQIMRRYDQASEEWRQFQHESTTQTLAFLSALSPEQRSKFVAIARERHQPWLRHHPHQQKH